MIEYLPTRIKITDCEENEGSSLKKSLSVWDKNRFCYKFFAYKYNEETKELILPGGISRFKLEKVFSDHNKIDNTRNFLIGCRKNKNIKILYPPRDNLQEKAIRFLCGNSFSSKSTQKLLSLATGSGKTYCSINYISTKRRIPLICVDLDTLVQQWKSSIMKFTDTKEDEIYILSGIKSVRKIIEMEDEEVRKIKFFIGFYKTIHSTCNKDLIEDLFKKVGFTTKIYDEAHTNYETIFKLDSITDCESIYLTATPERSDPIENKVFQYMLYDVKRFSSNSSNKSENDSNYHNIVLVKVDSKPNIDDEEECQNKYGFDVIKFSKYVLEERFDFFYEKIFENILFDIILKNGKKKRKTAILFNLKSMIKEFSERLLEDLNEKGFAYKIGILSEDTNKDIKQEVLNSDIIFTTDKSFGKAIDTDNLECVINFVPTSSKPKTIQMIGRLRKLENKEVYYFDVLDIGFDKIKVQIKNKQKAYQEKAKEIINLNL